MLGFLSLAQGHEIIVKKDGIYFVHIPDDMLPEAIRDHFAPVAQLFANHMNSDKVYLNYGKDEFIEYDYSI